MTVKSNFKLDDRIKSIDDIQTIVCNNQGFIGCKGFFFDQLVQTKDLTKCRYGTLVDIDINDTDDHCFKARDENGNELVGYYRFFLPESLLKEVKYRPLNKDEFLRMLNNGVFGQWITMKSVVTENEYYMQFTGCFTSELDIVYVCLGSLHFSLENLFKDFQWKDSDGNWRVFGVEVKEE